MNVCFDGICDEFPLFSRISMSGHWSGENISVFSLGRRYSDDVPPGCSVYNFSNFKPKDLPSEIQRITIIYPNLSFSSLISADRFLRLIPEDKAKSHIVSAILCFEAAVADGVEVFVTTGTAYAYHLVLLEVASKNSVKAVSLYPARLPSARFFYSLGNGSDWVGLKDVIEKEPWLDSDILDQSKISTEKPLYMKSVRQHGGVGRVFVSEFVRRSLIWLRNFRSRNLDYFTKNPFWYVKRDLGRLLRKPFQRIFTRWDKVDSEQHFFLYPLHLQPEASTLILGEFYEDELNNIKNISKSLPGNYRLLVKEHPAAFGRRSSSFYRQIIKIPNVSLVHPEFDGDQLLSAAAGLITVSGTMGIEALSKGKLVFVLGDVFYDIFPGVDKIYNWQDLRLKLLAISDRVPGSDVVFDPRHIMHQCSFEGLFDVCKLDTRKHVLDPNNVNLMAASLLKIVKRYV